MKSIALISLAAIWMFVLSPETHARLAPFATVQASASGEGNDDDDDTSSEEDCDPPTDEDGNLKEECQTEAENGAKAADPVQLLDGSFSYNPKPDLSFTNGKIRVGFTRNYSSKAKWMDNPMGKGWSASFDHMIHLSYPQALCDENLDYLEPMHEFKVNGERVPPTAIYVYERGKLTRAPLETMDTVIGQSGDWHRSFAHTLGSSAREKIRGLSLNYMGIITRKFEVRSSTGMIKRYSRHTRYSPILKNHCGDYFLLSEIEDRKGNKIVYDFEDHNGFPRVAAIRGPYSSGPSDPKHKLTIEYETTYETLYPKITKVSDWTGRQVTYQYDEDKLQSVHLTPNQAGARSESYTYTDRKLLDSITKPGNQSSGVPSLKNIYNSSNEVFRQVIKEGEEEYRMVHYTANAAGQPPLGCYWEETQKLWNCGSGSPWLKVKKLVLFMNPNGDTTLKVFDENGYDRISMEFSGRINHYNMSPNANGFDFYSLVQFDLSSKSSALNAALNYLKQGSGYFLPKIRSTDKNSYTVYREFNRAGMIKLAENRSEKIVRAYNDFAFDSYQWGRVIKETRLSVPYDGSEITVRTLYEPITGQKRFEKSNSGQATTWFFDYQEFDFLSTENAAKQNIYEWALGVSGINNWDGSLNEDEDHAYALSGLTEADIPKLSDTESSITNAPADNATDRAWGDMIVHRFPVANVYHPQTITSKVMVPQSREMKYGFNQWGLLKTKIEADGTNFEYFYYPSANNSGGNVTQQSNGMLARTLSPLTKQEEMAYDELGRANVLTDAKGNRVEIEFDGAGNKVLSTQTIGNLSIRRFWSHDLDSNVLSELEERFTPQIGADGRVVMDAGEVQYNPVPEILSTHYTRDHRGRTLETRVALNSIESAVTRTFYDRAGHLILTLSPEFENHSGRFEARLYDERGLIAYQFKGGVTDDFRTNLAHNHLPIVQELVDHPEAPATRGITYMTYDSAKRPRFQVLFYDPENPSQGRLTQTQYDSLGRAYRQIDSLGRCTVTQYDGESRAIQVDLRRSGCGGAESNILKRQYVHYDERGRIYRTDQEIKLYDSTSLPSGHILSSGPLTPEDPNLVTTLFAYSNEGRVIAKATDDGVVVDLEYDDLGRLIQKSERSGEWSISRKYDLFGNLLLQTRSERNHDGSYREFKKYNFYNRLGQLTAFANNAGQTQRMAYDTKGNLIYQSDARSSEVARPLSSLDPYGDHNPSDLQGIMINGDGNRSVLLYDLANRRTMALKGMYQNGDGALDLDNTQGGGDGRIIISSKFDRSGLIIEKTDDANKITEFARDAFGRMYQTLLPDNSIPSLIEAFNEDGNPLSQIDARGVRVTFQYDSNGRLLAKNINPGEAEYQGTLSQSYEYDDLGALRSISGTSSTGETSNIERYHDSLGRLIKEVQDGHEVVYGFDLANRKTAIYYPSGEKVERYFDSLSRVSEIKYQEAQGQPFFTLASFEYEGSRMHKKHYAHIPSAQTTTEYQYESDLGRLERIHAYVNQSSEDIDHRTFEYDASGNVTRRENLLKGVTELHQYDSLSRLTQSERIGAGADKSIEYTLDGIGNRLHTITDGELNPYHQDATDSLTNRYTNTPDYHQEFDLNGNLIERRNRTQSTQGDLALPSQGKKKEKFIYDFENRLTAFVSENGTRTDYEYDPLGRQVSEKVGSKDIRYLYSEGHVIEELNDGAIEASYVLGTGVDSRISMNRAGEYSFYHADLNANVVALTSATGAVQERYEYEDYGLLLDENYQPKSSSGINNPYLFQGRRLEEESGLYNFRARQLDPYSGRFTSMDPIGQWGDAYNIGNGYSFVGNNPHSRRDPSGLATESELGPDSIIIIEFEASHESHITRTTVYDPQTGNWTTKEEEIPISNKGSDKEHYVNHYPCSQCEGTGVVPSEASPNGDRPLVTVDYPGSVAGENPDIPEVTTPKEEKKGKLSEFFGKVTDQLLDGAQNIAESFKEWWDSEALEIGGIKVTKGEAVVGTVLALATAGAAVAVATGGVGAATAATVAQGAAAVGPAAASQIPAMAASLSRGIGRIAEAIGKLFGRTPADTGPKYLPSPWQHNFIGPLTRDYVAQTELSHNVVVNSHEYYSKMKMFVDNKTGSVEGILSPSSMPKERYGDVSEVTGVIHSERGTGNYRYHFGDFDGPTEKIEIFLLEQAMNFARRWK